MRFLVDSQLPSALVEHLHQAGHEAEHVHDSGLREASDEEIWASASERGAVIITKDEDFVALVDKNTSGPPVVWIRLVNTTNRALWHALQPLLTELLEALSSGEPLIEIR